VPYRDPVKRAAAQAESRRRRKRAKLVLAGLAPADPKATLTTPFPDDAFEVLGPVLPLAMRLRVPADALKILERSLRLVDHDLTASGCEKARVGLHIASMLLRALDSADIEERLTALEARANIRAVR
jgi:hypothetical protein